MGIKLKLPRKSNKALKRKRSVISHQLKQNVLKDYHVSKLTITSICESHSCCYETVRKIIDTTEYKSESFGIFNPEEINKRANLQPHERYKLLISDASRVVESIFAIIYYRLQQELINLENDRDSDPTISFKELMTLFAAVAPYVLPEVKSGNKSGEMLPPVRNIHNMFKTNH
jgi:transposase-like protein